jgi:hypothetical protein
MITPPAPARPLLGAGAHYNASVLPVQKIFECVQVLQHYRNRGKTIVAVRQGQFREDAKHLRSVTKEHEKCAAGSLRSALAAGAETA